MLASSGSGPGVGIIVFLYGCTSCDSFTVTFVPSMWAKLRALVAIYWICTHMVIVLNFVILLIQTKSVSKNAISTRNILVLFSSIPFAGSMHRFLVHLRQDVHQDGDRPTESRESLRGHGRL